MKKKSAPREPTNLAELAEAIRYHVSAGQTVPSTAHVYLLRRVDELMPGIQSLMDAAERLEVAEDHRTRAQHDLVVSKHQIDRSVWR